MKRMVIKTALKLKEEFALNRFLRDANIVNDKPEWVKLALQYGMNAKLIILWIFEHAGKEVMFYC